MLIFVVTEGDAIVDLLSSDGPFPIPPGAAQITVDDYHAMAAHPIGFGVFDYINGSVVLNDERNGEVSLHKNRRRKILDIRREALQRMGAIVPALTEMSQVDLVVTMLASDMITAPAPGSEMDRVKDIYLYGKTKIGQAQGATQSQLDAYDPSTDTNWPE